MVNESSEKPNRIPITAKGTGCEAPTNSQKFTCSSKTCGSVNPLDSLSPADPPP